MKTITLIIAVLLSCSIYSQEHKEEKKKEKKQVFICNSMTSKRYHYKKKCKGLEKCGDTIVKISIIKARGKFGRTICGYETYVESSLKAKN